MKTFDWYIKNALAKLQKSNFIMITDLDYDVKLGLYFIMKIYKLGFSQCVRGSWEFVMLSKSESERTGLKADEILAMPADMEEYNKAKAEFESGNLPTEAAAAKPKKDSQPFGWLSPMGDFYISDWGTHCISAENIIKNNNMSAEYEKWEKEDMRNIIPNDFLCRIKGYVLIHNPTNDGGYIVTNTKPLTKKTKRVFIQLFHRNRKSWQGKYIPPGRIGGKAMFTMYATAPPGGDCTAPYNVVLDKEYTVREFVDAVLTKTREWGYIGIKHKSEIFGKPNCEYRYGKLLNELPAETFCKKIVSVNASGGWSRMDYILTIERGELLE